MLAIRGVATMRVAGLAAILTIAEISGRVLLLEYRHGESGSYAGAFGFL